MEKNKTTSRLTDSQLEAIRDAATDNIDEIFDYFDLNLSESSRRYYGACPVHGGDKYNAFSISKDPSSMGNWRCYTRNCHKTFFSDIIGFVRGMISKTRLGWADPRDVDKMASFPQAVNLIINLTGVQGIENIKEDVSKVEKVRFSKSIATLFKDQKNAVELKIPKDKVLSSLQIPSPYYLSRGYSAEILEKYDVGFCNDPSKPFYKRSVAPIYDESGEFCIGCTGRSVFECCPICKCWHNPSSKCPESKKKRNAYSKWKHNYGFYGENYLYNYWYAKEHIQRDGFAIITESPGNVWRLEEAGFRHSLGTFGAHLTDRQRNILDQSGAMSLIVLSDPDEAGAQMDRDVENSCGELYSLYFPRISASDIGDTSIKLIQEKLTPIIERVKAQYV